jgi:hypothetical protein
LRCLFFFPYAGGAGMLLNINGKVFFMLIKKPISPSQLAKGQHRIILGKMLGSFLNEETPVRNSS